MTKKQSFRDFFIDNQHVIKGLLIGAIVLSVSFLTLSIVLGYLPLHPLGAWILSHEATLISFGIFFLGSSVVLTVFAYLYARKEKSHPVNLYSPKLSPPLEVVTMIHATALKRRQSYHQAPTTEDDEIEVPEPDYPVPYL